MQIDLHEKQVKLKHEIHKRNKLLKKQHVLEEQLQKTLERKIKYAKELKKEQKDVDDLDRFSILNILRGWSGRHDEKREKELSELAAIEAKYREVEKMATDLENDIRMNEIELSKVEWQNLDQQWALLKIEIEQWILQYDDIKASNLKKLYEEKGQLSADYSELEEAIYAGNKAKEALKLALKSLDNAKGYSTWDTFLGGGLLVTALKHSELENSEDDIHNAQLALQRFRTELLDIKDLKTDDLHVDMDSFVKFADYFFDDIFSAWSTHTKISSSIARVEETIDKLSELIDQLDKMLQRSKTKLEEIEKGISEILEGSLI